MTPFDVMSWALAVASWGGVVLLVIVIRAAYLDLWLN